MNYFNIYNLKEIIEKGIPQDNVERNLEGLGKKEFKILNGEFITIIVDGVLLTPKINGQNLFTYKDKSCFIDDETLDVWVGFADENNL